MNVIEASLSPTSWCFHKVHALEECPPSFLCYVQETEPPTLPRVSSQHLCVVYIYHIGICPVIMMYSLPNTQEGSMAPRFKIFR